ncbi:M4 family metallopeptidase [Actinomadura barringtoniae]|uniref:M4 family metallopeptidase n=1 Tax=Actinomadura barringtoniae TaxID=1427535 RepID=A0A939PKX4_9ACTN|nr:M4 family metallopeptidase [Actinomadura barringtoniae]MBO2454220.1 M4 family metallopeptidase [Actinomadura barringtoniae]
MRHQSALGAGAIAACLAVTLSSPVTAAAATSPPPAPPKPDAKKVAATAADQFVAAKPKTVHKAPEEKIVRRGVVSGQGGLQYVSYDRTYDGLPVYGGDFVVVTNSKGSVLSTTVAQPKQLDVSTKATVSSAQAAKVSRSQVSTVTSASKPALTVMAEGSGRLAYETVVTGFRKKAQTKLHVFVDAASGKVVGTWDEVTDVADDQSNYHGTVDLSTAATSMTDPTRSGLRCGGQDGATYTGTDSAWGNGSGTNLETACVDALYAVQKEWDMLGAWLGRSGINGSGGGFPARVGLNDENAFWNGSYTSFGHNSANSKQATSYDVVAHEFGHAIFQTTPGGSSGGSGNEKGGMNESTGDIFGALTEYYANEPTQYDEPDFLVGEEVNLVGSGPIRNMYNPGALGDPNCYSSSIPSTEVHAAAGPQNHWFYLLAKGSNPGGGDPASPTCNSSTVTGIGVQKAGQIFMGGLNRKVTAWSHARERIETINAAIQLFPGSATECNAVKAAWAAVSVPAQSGEASCGTQQNDFSLSLNPSSGSAQAGGSTTATVNTATTGGSAQTVALSATSSPSGPTASFSPASVTSGQSSTMTVNVPAGTPNGNYTITVLGDGASVDRTATYALSVGSTQPGTVFSDDFETNKGWTVNPAGTDTATTGKFERGAAQATSYSGTNLQLAPAGGSNDLVTGASAGTDVGANDIDGGVTSVQSPAITLPSGTLSLSFSWYLGHLNNASSADYLRVRVVGTTTSVAVNQTGSAANRSAAWANATFNLTPFAGQTVRIVVDAADAGGGSLVEAGIDNVTITKS